MSRVGIIVLLFVVAMASWILLSPDKAIRGDINRDGVLDWDDHEILADFLFRFPHSQVDTTTYGWFMDCNRDSLITVEDLVFLAKKIKGD